MLRKRTPLERRYQSAAWINSLRSNIHTAANYGESRFRSQTIAVCLVLTGLIHSLASFVNGAGSSQRVSCTSHRVPISCP